MSTPHITQLDVHNALKRLGIEVETGEIASVQIEPDKITVNRYPATGMPKRDSDGALVFDAEEIEIHPR